MMNSKIIAPPGIPAIFGMSTDVGDDVGEDAISSTEIKY